MSWDLGVGSQELLSIAHPGAHHSIPTKCLLVPKLEPPLFRLRSQLLTHSQQARQDSNLQPPVLETGALPLELRT
jgi:hypothetical protein